VSSSQVWCFALRKPIESSSSSAEIVYAGTGPEGKILVSKDLRTWTDFTTIDDCHIRSLAVWANALFIGTQPNGRIYVHNFTTGSSYLYVETEDSEVTAFTEFKAKLYAGTAPEGIVYSFDGTTWKEEHRPYGHGVTAMVSDGSLLFVFSRDAEGPVVFDGTSWKVMPSARRLGQSQTVASLRVAEKDIYGDTGLEKIDPNTVTGGDEARMASPVSPQFNLSAAAATAQGVLAGGTCDGVIIRLSDKEVTKVTDMGIPVNRIIDLDGNGLMVASGGTVLLVRTLLEGTP